MFHVPLSGCVFLYYARFPFRPKNVGSWFVALAAAALVLVEGAIHHQHYHTHIYSPGAVFRVHPLPYLFVRITLALFCCAYCEELCAARYVSSLCSCLSVCACPLNAYKLTVVTRTLTNTQHTLEGVACVQYLQPAN